MLTNSKVKLYYLRKEDEEQTYETMVLLRNNVRVFWIQPFKINKLIHSFKKCVKIICGLLFKIEGIEKLAWNIAQMRLKANCSC